jgi:hypothetical protein
MADDHEGQADAFWPRLRDQARSWCEGRSWYWRAPLLLLLVWNGLHQLRQPMDRGLFGGITFGSHEFGHLFFAAFGDLMAVAGGSLMQLLIPLGAIALLWRHGDFFGVAAGGTWLASSLMDLAVYIADARAYELDLVGFGEEAVHDWAWLLGRAGALQHDLQFAAMVRGLGVLVLAVSFLVGAWLCLQMASPARNSTAAGSS